MGKKAKITVHPCFEIGEISPRLFSAFLEPIGTMVNGTMYDPMHATADEQGFRTDVIEGLKQTGLPAVRMPGGNFVSAWNWKDSIGPKAERRVHLDPAWYQYYTNEVGHDEYLQWAEKVGTEPMYTVNLGMCNGSVQDAMDIVEYTNHEGGTYWSELRKKNGHVKPYGVKTWYLGNEMDGPWQIGSWEKNPKGYGILANEASKVMKWIDPTIETAVCGSSAPFMDHFPQWEEEVFTECYDSVDYLSIHHYHITAPGDTLALLGGAAYYEDFIEKEVAMLDYVAAKRRSPKKVMISFDEYGAFQKPLSPLNPGWGVYNMTRTHYHFDPERKYVMHDPHDMQWREFPGSEMIQMLSMASIQLALLRHADRVKIGCMTGGLGALCSTGADHVWRSASHYAFSDMINYAKGTAMRTAVDSETFDLPGYAIDDTSQYTGKQGLPYVDAASAWDKDNGRLTVFAINRNENESYPLVLDISGFEGYRFVSSSSLSTNDLSLKNSFEEPENLVPSVKTEGEVKNGCFETELAPLSWNVLIFEK